MMLGPVSDDGVPGPRGILLRVAPVDARGWPASQRSGSRASRAAVSPGMMAAIRRSTSVKYGHASTQFRRGSAPTCRASPPSFRRSRFQKIESSCDRLRPQKHDGSAWSQRYPSRERKWWRQVRRAVKPEWIGNGLNHAIGFCRGRRKSVERACKSASDASDASERGRLASDTSDASDAQLQRYSERNWLAYGCAESAK